MSNSRVVEILEKAADLLESGTLRWSQNSGYLHCTEEGNEGCAMGAVYLAANCAELVTCEDTTLWALDFRDEQARDAVDLAETRLRDKLGPEPGDKWNRRCTIEAWNDEEDRTLGEVVDLLKTVAKEAASE